MSGRLGYDGTFILLCTEYGLDVCLRGLDTALLNIILEFDIFLLCPVRK